jgi:AraC-like DNA-binding protein
MDQRNEGSVAAAFARALIDLSVEKGADRAELARRGGFAAGDLDDPDGRIPLVRYKALMAAAKEATRDPALALHFGEAFDITELSIVGLMGQACETASDAFALLPRFLRLAIDVELEEEAEGQRCVLRNVDGEQWLIDMRKNPNEFPELTESSFARMRTSGRRLGGASFWKEVHFTHAAPAHADEYARIFGVPVVFSSRWNAVLLTGEEWMAIRPPFPSPYLLAVLKERAEALLEAQDASASVTGRIEALITASLHERGAGMAAAAAKLGMSRATLARRLKREGTTFEAVLAGLRRRLADEYLGKRCLSVAETSYLLGFSEPAAFSRAYRRWTGRSPSHARGSATAGQ